MILVEEMAKTESFALHVLHVLGIVFPIDDNGMAISKVPYTASSFSKQSLEKRIVQGSYDDNRATTVIEEASVELTS